MFDLPFYKFSRRTHKMNPLPRRKNILEMFKLKPFAEDRQDLDLLEKKKKMNSLVEGID